MNKTQTEDENRDLEYVQKAASRVNANAATAVRRTPGLETSRTPYGHLMAVHRALIDTYGDARRALDTVEKAMDDRSNGHQATPRRIKSEHADRIIEDYDGPVLNLALMLLEHNRREWLHAKTGTHGEEQVERHGLTHNQREWLNQLRDAWRARDHVYDPRTIDDDRLARNLETVVTEARSENWGNVRVNLEAALESVDELENDGDA